ncbi:Hypothetical protein CINCED_3A023550 [Cinara cedri]|uniref:Uncharacterized protein n=1 Tax=Cinara cedri TaxID=506608 RepID=A0A5E4NC71_9HEMI|nr:Hypothetical protein CINCED_3A023550 [Cinara cedri]
MKQHRKLLYKHVFPSIVGRIKFAKQQFTESTKTVPVPQIIEKNNILDFDKTLIKVSSTSDVELNVFPLDVPSISSKVQSINQNLPETDEIKFDHIQWKVSMEEEMMAHNENKTWTLVR